MRISVVIIAFNLDAYIGQAVDSVLGQTRPADEIIVVDDCSTDNSAERVKAYGNKVRYLKMPTNSGALLAALEGVKASIGDVISMLDGDDYWASNKLEVVEQEFLADPELMLLSHHHVRVNSNGAELHVRDETHENMAAIRRRAASVKDYSSRLKETILEQKGYWLGSAYSFRRNTFDLPRFESQIRGFNPDRLKQTYLDLVIGPFLVLTNPLKNVGYSLATRFFYRIHDKASLGGNFTPEKALQSARKGRTINELIDLILRENQAPLPHLRRRQFLLQEYDYLDALYSGRIGEAARLYLRLGVNLWTWRSLKKETARLLAVGFLGPQRFLTLKRKI